jgi:hypothetical protein
MKVYLLRGENAIAVEIQREENVSICGMSFEKVIGN